MQGDNNNHLSSLDSLLKGLEDEIQKAQKHLSNLKIVCGYLDESWFYISKIQRELKEKSTRRSLSI